VIDDVIGKKMSLSVLAVMWPTGTSIDSIRK
jgi:hypothetical protein